MPVLRRDFNADICWTAAKGGVGIPGGSIKQHRQWLPDQLHSRDESTVHSTAVESAQLTHQSATLAIPRHVIRPDAQTRGGRAGENGVGPGQSSHLKVGDAQRTSGGDALNDGNETYRYTLCACPPFPAMLILDTTMLSSLKATRSPPTMAERALRFGELRVFGFPPTCPDRGHRRSGASSRSIHTSVTAASISTPTALNENCLTLACSGCTNLCSNAFNDGPDGF
ncbi:hypothetical protein BKA66DRAFT_164649 [Pyrenochaeta sp. MPI-SDFR-AT-0127]|nr:hypothetical protein BKA66DRAFT_164649 [Pyrenochaeta sp. MPI-SDFR-AT-0127]